MAKNKEILLIVAVAFFLRIIFLSPWLEDWDSVQFALALDNFSVTLHQPHPPGYPIYILLTKILDSIFRNDNLSLTLLSAIFSSLSCIPLFLLLKQMTNKIVALLGILIFIFTPVEWTLSEVGLSNIPGMFFTILTSFWLFKGIKQKNYLYMASFLAGISLGVRLAEYSILISLLILVLLFRKNARETITSITLFLMGVLIWLIPLILITGFNEFINLYTNQASYIANHDSLISYSSFTDRLKRIWDLFILGYSRSFIFIIAIILISLGKNNLRGHSSLFTFVWLFSYLIPLIFLYNLEVPRHILPLLPPLIMLFCLNLYKIKSNFTKFAFLIIIPLSFVSLGQVTIIHTQIPPTIAPVLYVKQNFKSDETLIIAEFTYRQFQYYGSEFKSYYGVNNLPKDFREEYVVLDYLGTKDKIQNLNNYDVSKSMEFSGPVDVFPRISKTNLYILKRRM